MRMLPSQRFRLRHRSCRTGFVGTSISILLACIGIPNSSSAQEARWSIAAGVGYLWPGDLFRHEFTRHVQEAEIEGDARYFERVRTADMATFGASVDYRFAAGWTVSLQAEHGSSHYEYRETQHWNGELQSETWSSRTAAMTSLGFSLGRELTLQPRTSLNVSVDTRVHRLAPLDRKFQEVRCAGPVITEYGCPRNSPAGFFTPAAIPSWDRRYSIPGIGSSVRISRRLTQHIGLQAGASYAVGKADTSVFWADLSPELDRYEAPKTYWMSTSRLFVRWYAYF